MSGCQERVVVCCLRFLWTRRCGGRARGKWAEPEQVPLVGIPGGVSLEVPSPGCKLTTRLPVALIKTWEAGWQPGSYWAGACGLMGVQPGDTHRWPGFMLNGP